MKNLVPYDESPDDAFDAIVSAKERSLREILTKLRPTVLQRYELYAQYKTVLETMLLHRSFSDDEAEALVHCYNDTNALKDLKNKIRGVQPHAVKWSCQYCGLGPSDTWDHYLPKARSAFPEFAVYPPNLIPCCPTCNNQRHGWLDRQGQRTTINFYYDQVEPDEELVEALITLDDGPPDVAFALKPGASNTKFGKLFSRHWHTLQLDRRYSEQARTKLEAIGIDIQVSTRPDVAGIMEELDLKAARSRDLVGANHMEVLLYRAVAASRQIVEYFLRQPSSGDGPQSATINPTRETQRDI